MTLSALDTSMVAFDGCASPSVPDASTSAPIPNGADAEPRHASGMESGKEERLSWEEYFMALAFLCGQRSKDPVTQVGACIVNDRSQILSTGYNGMPRGCPDAQMPWGKRNSQPLKTKSWYVCHAELNAILNKNSADVLGGRVYVSLFPCNECSKLIIQSGISSVVYYSDKHAHKNSTKASKAMLTAAGVTFRQYSGNIHKLTLIFGQVLEKLDPSICESVAACAINDDGSTSSHGHTTSNQTSDNVTGLVTSSPLPPVVNSVLPTSPTSTCVADGPRPSSECLSWDEYFMAVAFLSARRCKNPLEQAGACLVNSDNRIVGIGYNGLPRRCPSSLPQTQGLDKSLFECHAEINAVMNKNCTNVRNCSLYVTQFPCNECAKLIVQAGIKKVVYFSEPPIYDESFEAARWLFDITNTTHLAYASLGSLKKRITLDFHSIEK